MKNTEPIHILSDGLGMQSSTIKMMAEAGLILPKPIAAIFADTKAEPQALYTWRDWINSEVSFPCYTVSKGDLGADFLKALSTEKGRCAQPPFFVKSKQGEIECRFCKARCKTLTGICDSCGSINSGRFREPSIGVLWRQCTPDYKIMPIRRKARELAAMHGTRKIIQWIGISTDEAHRMKDSGVKYITNRYPLIELGMSRRQCLAWMKERGFPKPPKSACVWCPYHNDAMWRDMKENQPLEFERAVKFERAMKGAQETKLNGAKIYGDIFLHRSGKPLDEIDFRTKDEKRGQINFFGNECEGMCGV